MRLLSNARPSRATVELDASYDKVYDLCHEALSELLGCMTTDRDRASRRLRAVCQYKTVASGAPVGIVFTFDDGPPVCVTISAPATYPGRLSGSIKAFRNAAVNDLARFLADRAGGRVLSSPDV